MAFIDISGKAMEVRLCGAFEFICIVEDLVTLKPKAAMRIFVMSEDGSCIYYDAITLVDCPE